MRNLFSLEKAISYINENGSEIEKARLDSILGNKIDKTKLLSSITEFQNADGGFSLSRNGLSNLSDTGFVLTWLSDLDLLSNEITLNCFSFFCKMQNDDGSWKEIEYEKGIDIPEWKESTSIKSVLYQTANTMFWLYKYSNNTDCINNGINFLERNYSRENAYLHTKWLLTAILSKKYSWSHEIVKRLFEEIIESLSDDMPPSMITWMLWDFSIYEIPKEKENLREVIKKIKQDKDGGINSEDGDSYRVNATIERIKVLQYYKG